MPLPVLWVIASWYVQLWAAGLTALLRSLRRGQWRALVPAICLIVGFFCVHLVYWTDGRMRAPVMPAMAMLIAVGWSRWMSDSPQQDADCTATVPE